MMTKSFGPCHPALFAQDDKSRYFFPEGIKPPPPPLNKTWLTELNYKFVRRPTLLHRFQDKINKTGNGSESFMKAN